MRRPATLLASLLVAVSATALAVPATQAGEDDLPVTYNFLASAVAAGASKEPNAPGTNDWTCQPTQRHPRPVVLVHGTAGNRATNWQTYGPLLKNHGYCVFALNYGLLPFMTDTQRALGGMTRMQESAETLASFVRRVRRATGAAKVDFVGHSQGTLMPNYYVKFLGGDRFVKKYVSLAPLWHGTEVATPLTQLAKIFGAPSADLGSCESCRQMTAGSAFIKKMRSGGLAVDGVDYTNIMTRYDQLVLPYTSGHQRGMRNLVVQDFCATDLAEHFEIAADPIGSVLVLNALDPAHPRPVPCMLVLPFTGPLT